MRLATEGSNTCLKQLLRTRRLLWCLCQNKIQWSGFEISDDEAGYGQVVSLRSGVDPDLLQIWIAPTRSVAAPFNPWWMGVRSIPPEYGENRYLTQDAAGSFLSPDFQLQKASYFAGQRFKQVLYYMCAAPETLLPVVTDMLKGIRSRVADGTEVG